MKISERFKNELCIARCKFSDYEKLARYHYVKRCPPPQKHIYKITQQNQFRARYPDPVGIIIYSFPVPMLKARNIATDNYFLTPPTRKERLKLVNKKLLYISRIIIDPRYWKLGLATWLLAETLKLQTVPMIETLTPIDFTNEMFKKAGFKFYTNPEPMRYKIIKDTLTRFGITGTILKHPQIVQKRINTLEPEDQEQLYYRLKRFLHAFPNVEKDFWQPEAIAFILNQLEYPQAYLIKETKEHQNFRRHPQ